MLPISEAALFYPKTLDAVRDQQSSVVGERVPGNEVDLLENYSIECKQVGITPMAGYIRNDAFQRMIKGIRPSSRQ